MLLYKKRGKKQSVRHASAALHSVETCRLHQESAMSDDLAAVLSRFRSPMIATLLWIAPDSLLYFIQFLNFKFLKALRACAAPEELTAEGASNCAGTSGSGGASSAAKDAAGGGMRLYLSQIKEWMVEYACDMCFIMFRTDCAWYKIRSVHETYRGWFAPILKVTRLAVKLLGMIQNESRSSRISFADIVKRLAAQAPTEPTFISTKDLLVRCFCSALFPTNISPL
jgi:hypothetical protein